MVKQYIERNEEVLYTQESVVCLDKSEIHRLETKAKGNVRGKVRLCAHLSEKDLLHEMIVIHSKNTYVRPHKHVNKSESLHVIEGSVDIVMLDDAGEIIGVTQMGEYSSGRSFYHRISEPCYHALLISSEVLIFHEATNGPFKPSETVWAPWAPEQNDLTAGKEYMERLAGFAGNFLSAKYERG